MPLLRRQQVYDRSRILDAANRARARKQRRRAIELYRWVLAVEPKNVEIHARLAPLLAAAREPFDAWLSYKVVAQALLREGQPDKALAVYREAALKLPREDQAWLAVARLQHKRGNPRDALDTLVEGSRNFRSRRLKPRAIHLLRRAREVEPWSFEVVIELARLLARTGQRQEARILLDGLAERSIGERLRRVRGAQLGLSPGPGSAWRWVRAALAALSSAPAGAHEAPRGSGVVPFPRRSARGR